jgi:hypothetical protein
MMNSRLSKLLLAVFLIAVAGCVSAQMADRAQLDNMSRTSSLSVKPAANPFSLLDMSRISWSHSYSVSFFSGGAMSGSVGLLNSTLLYEFSPKLSLSVNLGVAHSAGQWGQGRETTVLPGFTLDYHPSEKFRLTFMVQRYDAVLNPLISRSNSWYNPAGLR